MRPGLPGRPHLKGTSVTSSRRNVVAAVIVAAVGLLAAGAAYACTALASLAINPAQGVAGTPVTVQGDGFRAGAPVSVRWNDGEKVVGQAVPDATGFFSVSFVVPADAPNGDVVVSAKQEQGGSQAVIFTVGTPQAAPQPEPTPAPQQQQATPAPAPAVAPVPVTVSQPATQPAPSTKTATAPVQAAPAASATQAQQPATAVRTVEPPTPSGPTPAAAPEGPVAVAADPAPPVRAARPQAEAASTAVVPSSSSSQSTPAWLLPAILLGVLLAVASMAVVAGTPKRRRSRAQATVGVAGTSTDTIVDGPLRSE